MQAGTITFEAAGGDEITGYLAHPLDETSVGSVVVIHHMPGYDEGSKEITRRFAVLGYAALCPNLHHRDAPGADPDDAAAVARAAGGVPDERLLGDVHAAIDHLRNRPGSNGKVGSIGFCSGGRQSVLAACRLPLDAAVDCYGAFVVGTPPKEFPLKVGPLYDVLGDLRCPLLGLFGNEDKYPAPAEVEKLDRILTELDKPHEFHSFDDAGHAFFAVDRPSYRPAVATEAWGLVRDFFGTHLATERSNA
jgi:carboxymethylenebutenolidase